MNRKINVRDNDVVYVIFKYKQDGHDREQGIICRVIDNKPVISLCQADVEVRQ